MYVYNADVWCDSCGEDIAANLRALGHEDDGDSDSFPQYVPEDGETDGPQHCASASTCLEAVDLTDWGLAADAPRYGAEARTVGAILNDSLTEYGTTYLREMLAEPEPTPYQRALFTLWRETFDVPAVDIDAATSDAEKEGYEAGKAAGSWVIDGNTSDETARALLQGIEDGDPAVLNQLPDSPLSGKWADAPTPRDVLGWYELTEDDDGADDVLTAYKDGFTRGVMDEVTRAARYLIED